METVFNFENLFNRSGYFDTKKINHFCKTFIFYIPFNSIVLRKNYTLSKISFSFNFARKSFFIQFNFLNTRGNVNY